MLLLLRQLRALRHQDAVIVLGVLEIVLLHYAITGRARIAGKLKIFLVHVRGRATNLHIRSCGIKGPVVVVVMIVVLRPAAAST